MVVAGPYIDYVGTYEKVLPMGTSEPGNIVQAGGSNATADPYVPWDDATSTDALIGTILAENNGPSSYFSTYNIPDFLPGDSAYATSFVQILTLPDNEFSTGPRINPANVQYHPTKQYYSNMVGIATAVADGLVTPPTLPPDAEYYQWESSFGTLIDEIKIESGLYKSGGADTAADGGRLYINAIENNIFHPLSEIHANSPAPLILAPTPTDGSYMDIPAYSVDVLDIFPDPDDQGDIYLWVFNDSLVYPGTAERPRPSGLKAWETQTADQSGEGGTFIRVTVQPPRYRFFYSDPLTGANLHPLRQRQLHW